MDIVNLIIALISGAVGGNVTGTLMKEGALGGLGNTIAGLLGGGLGDFILRALGVLASTGVASATGAAGSEFDIGHLLATIGASGASGGVLTAIITFIKNAMNKA